MNYLLFNRFTHARSVLTLKQPTPAANTGNNQKHTFYKTDKLAKYMLIDQGTQLANRDGPEKVNVKRGRVYTF
jgi:hypothetical protein